MATTAPYADHEIPVKLDPGTPEQPGPHAIPAIPPTPPDNSPLVHGQTVHYFSDDGEVTIEFVVNGSPFQDANGNDIRVISSNDPPRVLTKVGTFMCHGFITPPGTTTRIGWDPVKSPELSGGNHVVR